LPLILFITCSEPLHAVSLSARLRMGNHICTKGSNTTTSEGGEGGAAGSKKRKSRDCFLDIFTRRRRRRQRMEEEEVTPVADGLDAMNIDDDVVPRTVPQTQRNFNIALVSTLNFHIPHGYDDTGIEYLGGGSYGNVAKARAVIRGDGRIATVAIKKMHHPFGSVNTARRVFREIRLLQLMRHDNVIRAVDLYSPDKNLASFGEMYVVTEYAGPTLYEVLKNQREMGVVHLQLEHVKFILYQLLRGLKYIHSANVMHRDLKPSNLSLTSSCDLTVLDFGLARTVEQVPHGMSTYVMTRWYRSPEVIYWKIGSYDKQADVWSVGCIAAEMLIGHPLFPGESTNQQYDMITALCGAPDPELLHKISQIEDNNNGMIRQVIERLSLGRQRKDFFQYFRSFVPDLPDDAISFIDQLLQLDPERRLTVEQALQHPYLVEYRDEKDEPTVAEPYTLEDNVEYTISDWRRIIWNEIQAYRGDEGSPPFI
ncbi:pmk-3, partial [Pristionchus pacificus]